jgi:hypothetical protein
MEDISKWQGFVDRKDVLLEESPKLREELRAETPDSTCFKSLILRCAVVDTALEMLCDGAGTYPDAWDALKSTPRLSKLFGGFNVKISRKTSWRYTTLPEPPLPNGIQRKNVQKFDDEIYFARVLELDEQNDAMTFERIASLSNEELPETFGGREIEIGRNGGSP